MRPDLLYGDAKGDVNMRFLRQSLVGLFLAGISLALLTFAVQTIFGAVQERMAEEKFAPPARERIFAVNVEVAKEQAVIPVLDVFGEVQSRRSLELRSAVGGRIIYLSPSFEEGGTVSAGDLLIRVDQADARAALDRARTDMADAQSEQRDATRALELARDEVRAAQEQANLRERALQRQKDLEVRGVGTAAAVENAELSAAAARQSVLSRRLALAQAETRIDQAATRLARMEIALSDAERTLKDTEVFAPFDGMLSGVSVVEGGLVAPNEKLGNLVDANALEVVFRVSTAQYARLIDETGAVRPAWVQVFLDGADMGLSGRGRLSRDSAGGGELRTGRVLYASLDQAAGFKPGDFVSLKVMEPAVASVVRLPATAYGADGAVLALDPDERLESLPVTLVRRQGDDVLLRGDGLAGRQVVRARTPLLGPGIKVRPILAVEGAAPAIPAAPELLDLSEERRARLVAFVEGNKRMPDEMRQRILAQLSNQRVPAALVNRIESRMGG